MWSKVLFEIHFCLFYFCKLFLEESLIFKLDTLYALHWGIPKMNLFLGLFSQAVENAYVSLHFFRFYAFSWNRDKSAFVERLDSWYSDEYIWSFVWSFIFKLSNWILTWIILQSCQCFRIGKVWVYVQWSLGLNDLWPVGSRKHHFWPLGFQSVMGILSFSQNSKHLSFILYFFLWLLWLLWLLIHRDLLTLYDSVSKIYTLIHMFWSLFLWRRSLWCGI